MLNFLGLEEVHGRSQRRSDLFQSGHCSSSSYFSKGNSSDIRQRIQETEAESGLETSNKSSTWNFQKCFGYGVGPTARRLGWVKEVLFFIFDLLFLFHLIIIGKHIMPWYSQVKNCLLSIKYVLRQNKKLGHRVTLKWWLLRLFDNFYRAAPGVFVFNLEIIIILHFQVVQRTSYIVLPNIFTPTFILVNSQ